jgi:hypothetical protein
MSLAPFLNRHTGETAWLFGKGPSLSSFDFKNAGPLRVAINDVAAHVPDCRYCFANDGVGKWSDVYKPGQTLFQPVRCMHEYDSRVPGAVACDVVTFDDTQDDTRLRLPREQLAELPTIRRGTLGSALQILHVMGVRAVYMVGIDGGGTHAPGYEWRTRLRAVHAKDYNAIRSAAIDAAFIMGIALRFHNQDHNLEPNGMIFVRFLKNAMVKAEPYALGEIASFAPHIARELFACRAAEHFIPTTPPPPFPAPIAIESAAMTMQAVESAVIETKKTRKPRGK